MKPAFTALSETLRAPLLQVLLQVALTEKPQGDESHVQQGFHSMVLTNDQPITNQVAIIDVTMKEQLKLHIL